MSSPEPIPFATLQIPNVILKFKIQRMIKLWRKACKKSKHRINILKEWSATQKTYIQDLLTIMHRIQEPLLQAQLITAQEDRILFPNLKAMLKLSNQVFELVNNFLATWNPHHTLIAGQLINVHNYFIIYREYCNNFSKAQKIIKSIRHTEQCEEISRNLPMDIQSFIIKPVQRPPKYQLLLRQYQKAININHKDYQKLGVAIEKYHEVNQENNKSMDLQIRNDAMISLDLRYGGIINTTRVYLFEETAKCIDFKVKVYFFNDMVLVAKMISDDKEEGYKKILLDGLSFVESPMDGKYLINKLFICGIKQNVHLNFMNPASRDRTHDRLQLIISELYRKQINRQTIKKKTKMKMTVMKVPVVKSRPQLRVTVVGVQKRPASTITRHFNTFYILKIQAPNPNNIFQHSYVRFDTLLNLQKQIRNKYRMLTIPTLDDKPSSMGIYDVKKNRTEIIESRHIYIERFINFLLRSQQLQEFLQRLVDVLKINEDLWKFVSFLQPCSCDICCQNKGPLTLQEYQQQKSLLKTFGSHFSATNSSQNSESSCIYNSLNTPNRILETPVDELKSLHSRLLWMECKLGRIDYTLIPKNQQQNKFKVSVSLLSLRQDESINIKIGKKTTVLQVIDQIADIYQIQDMRDFGLFLDYQDAPRLLDRDEMLFEALIGIQHEFEQSNQEKIEDNAVWKKRFSDLKKWGQEIITGKKSKLYVKKYLFVDDKLEIAACQQNPQRYSILVEEIFYRFKNQLLILNSSDTKSICALYYVLSFMDKLAHLNMANFQSSKLKSILPQSKHHLINEFEKEVFQEIKSFQKLMENGFLPSNRRSSSTSNLLSRIEILYDQVLKIAHKALGWNTMFFEVTNYNPSTLPGNNSNLLLGVNRGSLVVIRHKQLEPLLEIDLSKLVYKVTVLSIFIETQEKVLRFDGTMMYGVKNLIQLYKLMDQKFGNID